MEEKPEKRELNVAAIFITLLLVGTAIGAMVWESIDSTPDYAVTKKKITPAGLVDFRKKIEQMVLNYTVRHEGIMPIVHPPAGSDIYILARHHDWGKYILELEQGKPYRLHLTSLDVRHSLVVHKLNLINRLPFGELITVEFSPAKAGRFELKCGDYCGPQHHNMIGTIIVLAAHASVLDKPGTPQ
jgi:heme/copper-type cytochrome/quinol oxidase subunit 2